MLNTDDYRLPPVVVLFVVLLVPVPVELAPELLLFGSELTVPVVLLFAPLGAALLLSLPDMLLPLDVAPLEFIPLDVALLLVLLPLVLSLVPVAELFVLGAVPEAPLLELDESPLEPEPVAPVEPVEPVPVAPVLLGSLPVAAVASGD